MNTLVRFIFMLAFAVALFVVGQSHSYARGYYTSISHSSSYHVSTRSYSPHISSHRSSVFHSQNKAYSVKHNSVSSKIKSYHVPIIKHSSVRHSTTHKHTSIKRSAVHHIKRLVVSHKHINSIHLVKLTVSKHINVSHSLNRLFKAPIRHVTSVKHSTIKHVHIAKSKHNKRVNVSKYSRMVAFTGKHISVKHSVSHHASVKHVNSKHKSKRIV